MVYNVMEQREISMRGLTLVQREFLKILESFMHEKEYSFPKGFSGLKELYEIASIHKLTAAVYERIRQDPVLFQEENAGLANAFKTKTIHEAVFQAQMEDAFYESTKDCAGKGFSLLS